MTRLIFAAYFLEAGLILILAPWSSFWDRNGLAWMVPVLRSWLSNHFVRGAVTGVGVITACAGLVELAGVFGLGRSNPAPDAATANGTTHSEH